jgi:menaquinone-9 beta-reductase
VSSPEQSTIYDAVVVGAGPAGAAAAITLARRNRRVIVIDKATFPRDKCCGDGLTTGALRELELLGFSPSAVPSWQVVNSAWVRSPAGFEVEFPFPNNNGIFGAVAPRAELDNALVELVRSHGVEVREGVGVGAVHDRPEAETVEISLDNADAPLRARAVIAADGMWSPTRKMLGLHTPGYLGEWHAFRQYFDNVTGPAAERLYVWFEPDLLPGYAWSFPLPGGRANVGFGVERDGKRRIQSMADLWPELLARPHIAAALGPNAAGADRHLAWPIPARVDRVSLGAARVVFVGDAAAVTDVMTGEGIGQALLTGRLAAEALDAGPINGLQIRYRRAVQHHLFADHRMSTQLARILRHQRGAEGSIRIAATNDWTRRNFGRWLFEDEPRAALFTPKRWHRKFLTRPGAHLG